MINKKITIAIIGATIPEPPYDAYISFLAGLEISNILTPDSSILVGGVEGVGLHAFMGYTASKRKPKPIFYAVIPSHIKVAIGKEKDDITIIPYYLPKPYRDVSISTASPIQVVKKGDSMQERRKELIKMADIGIIINGGDGTADEAVMLIEANKPLIAIQGSGGYADISSDAVNDIPFISTEHFFNDGYVLNRRRFYNFVKKNSKNVTSSSISNIETTLQEIINKNYAKVL